jgi:hypothetical protein
MAGITEQVIFLCGTKFICGGFSEAPLHKVNNLCVMLLDESVN